MDSSRDPAGIVGPDRKIPDDLTVWMVSRSAGLMFDVGYCCNRSNAPIELADREHRARTLAGRYGCCLLQST